MKTKMSNREILKKKIETAKNQTPTRRIELKIYADIPQYLKIEDLEQYLYHRMKYNIDIKRVDVIYDEADAVSLDD